MAVFSGIVVADKCYGYFVSRTVLTAFPCLRLILCGGSQEGNMQFRSMPMIGTSVNKPVDILRNVLGFCWQKAPLKMHRGVEATKKRLIAGGIETLYCKWMWIWAEDDG